MLDLKLSQIVIRETLYDDDAEVVEQREDDMQVTVDHLSGICTALRLTISLKNIKVMSMPLPGLPYIEPNIFANRFRLEVVETFV